MNNMSLDFFRGKRVFLTGYTGFKGTWLCRILTQAGAEVTGYALPARETPNLFELAGIEHSMHCIYGDIRDLTALYAAFSETRPEIVFHLAAQPIVRVGYRDPVYTYETNVMGTVNLLECARLQGGVRSFLNVTTDKVYLNREWEWPYRENEALDGTDPYSNSKSCSELITHCYLSSYFLNSNTAISTARAGNVIGGGDFSEDRIIPDCIRAVLSGEEIHVRNPHSIRPYQHVLEALFAYLLIVQRQYEEHRFAGWYNVGPDDCDCITTGELTDLFCDVWGGGSHWSRHSEESALREASFLRLDSSRLKSNLGWRPCWNIRQAMEKTCSWTKVWQSGGDVPAEMDRQIQEYKECIQ